jgi:ATP synthase F1 delta subunit
MNHIPSYKTVARKYAQAFLTIYESEITHDDIKKINDAEKYLRNNKKILTLLSIPVSQQKTQQAMIENMIAYFSLKNCFISLFSLILSRHHTHLIPQIFWYINQIYKYQHDTIDCLIISSHDLTQTAIDSIVRFFKGMTGKNTIYTHIIDKKLIAGIRLQSPEYLWEYSVRKQIQSIAHSCENRGS